MTISNQSKMYPHDPQKIVYHSVHPDPCYKPERAGKPIGNGIYHATRYKLASGIEVSLNKATQVKGGLELEIGFANHIESFFIPEQDKSDFINDANLNFFQKLMIGVSSKYKPKYHGVKLTAFLNIYDENKLFGLIALTKYGENEHLYQDCSGKIFYISSPEGIGIGGLGHEFLGDPDVLDRLGQFERMMNSSNAFIPF